MSSHAGPATSPAEVYEDFLVRWQFRPWTTVLLAEAALRPGERILDLATGTGIVAREAAPFVGASGHIVAIDINPAMLAVGLALPAPNGATIEWREGDAAKLPLPDATVDVVLCQQGLQYFPDRVVALAEVQRVLRSGGRAVFEVWQPLVRNPVHQALNEAAQQRLGIAPFATAFSLGDMGEVHALVEGAGFGDVTLTPRELVVVLPSREDFVRRAIESAAQIVPELADLDAAGRAALAQRIDEEASEALRAYRWGDGIALPLAAHLIHVRR